MAVTSLSLRNLNSCHLYLDNTDTQLGSTNQIIFFRGIRPLGSVFVGNFKTICYFYVLGVPISTPHLGESLCKLHVQHKNKDFIDNKQPDVF